MEYNQKPEHKTVKLEQNQDIEVIMLKFMYAWHDLSEGVITSNEYDVLFWNIVSEAKKSSFTIEEIQSANEKGRQKYNELLEYSE